MRKVAPSILSANFCQLAEEIKAVDLAGCDEIHIDIMDGTFVPNISFGAMIVKQIRPLTQKPFDVHFMITNPAAYIKEFEEAGADSITVHIESDIHIHRLISEIKASGIKAGITLNPGTPLSAITEVLPMVDRVLVMSVNPGFGGQKFIAGAIDRVKTLAKWRKEMGYHYDIEVDGGVSPENAAQLGEAGADLLVAGSAVFGAADRQKAIRQIKGLSECEN